ncbi:hypothetical protein HMPREF1514_0605 [Streptococcus sp. AS20]|nr:hypothetical protein HMPREF1514_0605 [Streptococcus sp. AS20]
MYTASEEKSREVNQMDTFHYTPNHHPLQLSMSQLREV